MSILGAEPITLRTFAASNDYTGGVYAPGAPTDTIISGSVQPLEGKDRQLLPEGERHRDGKKVYTKTALSPVDQYLATNAQHLIIDTIEYEVHNVKQQRSVIPHFKALVLRIQESE